MGKRLEQNLEPTDGLKTFTFKGYNDKPMPCLI
jgi:hypothetical protein